MSPTSRIREIAEAKLMGRQIDVGAFVDGLLAIAVEAGTIRCLLASDQSLRFELGDNNTCEVGVDSCRGKLRMMCARLGVLCNKAGGNAVSLYGGEGVIQAPASNGREPHQWAVRFMNTPAEHEFTIVATKIGKPSVATSSQR
jgi:hypothetical protein